MPRPSRPWFRFYVEAMQDPKMRGLIPSHRWLWVALLGMARSSCSPGRLLVAEGMPYTEAEMADYAALRAGEVRSGLRELERRRMVTNDDGTWVVTRWEERQYESDNSTMRTAKHRSKERDRNVSETADGTDQTQTAAAEASADRRGGRIPDDWWLTDDDRAWAALNCPDIDLELHTTRFKNHWQTKTGRDATKLDWTLTWHNWVLLEQSKVKPTTNGHAKAEPARPLLGPWECSIGNPDCHNGHVLGDDGRARKCGCQSTKASARG